MKRCNIGNTNINEDSNIFLLDTPLFQMRQSEVRIMSYLDLLQSQAKFTNIDSELQRIYNEMDKYYCLAMIVENLGDNEAYLINAFYVFNEAIEKGIFDRSYTDMIERNNIVNQNVCNIINDSINYNITDSVIDANLWNWWQANILDVNFYTDPATGDHTKNKPLSVPVSINGEIDYVGTFKKSACCYAYTEVNADKIANSKIATIKRKKQNEVRNALSICDVQLDQSVQSNYVRSGIMEATNGDSPEVFVNRIINAKKTKIGELAAAIASIIVAAITFLTSLVSAIISYRKAKLTKEAETALNSADQYAPAESDFFNIDIDGDGKSDLSKILLIGAAALALYYYL